MVNLYLFFRKDKESKVVFLPNPYLIERGKIFTLQGERVSGKQATSLQLPGLYIYKSQ